MRPDVYLIAIPSKGVRNFFRPRNVCRKIGRNAASQKVSKGLNWYIWGHQQSSLDEYCSHEPAGLLCENDGPWKV